MRRLRCGETSCSYHIGGCTANGVQVNAQSGAPCCATYFPKDPVKKSERYTRHDASDFARAEFGDAEPRAELYRVSCTASDCLRNRDCMCRAAWLEIGFPKEYDGVDIRCKSYVSGCGQGSLQNK